MSPCIIIPTCACFLTLVCEVYTSLPTTILATRIYTVPNYGSTFRQIEEFSPLMLPPMVWEQFSFLVLINFGELKKTLYFQRVQ